MPRDAISSEERRRRQAAVNFARANVGLEGFKLSEASETSALKFINGEITLADFVRLPPSGDKKHQL
jgi:hypothetical protein